MKRVSTGGTTKPCERCDVERWHLWKTLWGYLCSSCRWFVPVEDARFDH